MATQGSSGPGGLLCFRMFCLVLCAVKQKRIKVLLVCFTCHTREVCQFHLGSDRR